MIGVEAPTTDVPLLIEASISDVIPRAVDEAFLTASNQEVGIPELGIPNGNGSSG